MSQALLEQSIKSLRDKSVSLAYFFLLQQNTVVARKSKS